MNKRLLLLLLVAVLAPFIILAIAATEFKGDIDVKGSVQIKKQTSPTNPPAGSQSIYPKSDGSWATRTETGVETPVGSSTLSVPGSAGDVMTNATPTTLGSVPQSTFFPGGWKVAYTKNSASNLTSGESWLSDAIVVDTSIVASGATACYPLFEINGGAHAATTYLLNEADKDSLQGTVLLLHCDGEDDATSFPDGQPYTAKTVTAGRGAVTDTAQYKFGLSSACFPDTTAGYLSIPDSDDFYFGTGDFTVDFWMMLTANEVNRLQNAANIFDCVYGQTVTEGDRQYFLLSNELGPTNWHVGSDATVLHFAASSYTALTWYHIALVRSGNSWNVYENGVGIGAQTNAMSIDNIGDVFLVGEYDVSAGAVLPFAGWIDDFRVSKGIARWTANFTPPAAAHSNVTSRATLTNGQSNTFTAVTDYPLFFFIDGIAGMDMRGGAAYFK